MFEKKRLLGTLMIIVLLAVIAVPTLAMSAIYEDDFLQVVNPGQGSDNMPENNGQGDEPVTEPTPAPTPVSEPSSTPTAQPTNDVEPTSGDSASEAPSATEPKDSSATDVPPAPTAVPSYTIRFLDKEGYVIKKVTLQQGEPIVKPKLDVEIEGYQFLYWYDARVGNVAFQFDVAATKDLTLRPCYVELPEPTEAPNLANGSVEGAKTAVQGNQTDDENMDENEDDTLAVLNTGDPEQAGDIENEGDGDEQKSDQPQGTQTPADVDQTNDGEDAFLPLDNGDGEQGSGSENERSVTMVTNASGEVNIGDLIELRAILKGYAGAEVEIRWQCNDGSGWKDVQTDGLFYSFALTEENYRWDWQVCVKVIQEPTADIDE